MATTINVAVIKIFFTTASRANFSGGTFPFIKSIAITPTYKSIAVNISQNMLILISLRFPPTPLCSEAPRSLQRGEEPRVCYNGSDAHFTMLAPQPSSGHAYRNTFLCRSNPEIIIGRPCHSHFGWFGVKVGSSSRTGVTYPSDSLKHRGQNFSVHRKYSTEWLAVNGARQNSMVR